MHINRVDCRKLTPDQIKHRIDCFTECGWIYEGILQNSPPPHEWLSFIWEKDNEPIYPAEFPKQSN